MSGIGRARAPSAVSSAERRVGTEALSGTGGARASWLLYAAIPALSALNAVVGLVLPMLLGPLSFGEYSLATTLFQYGLIFDLGLSQTIDRRVPILLQEGGPALARFVSNVMGLRLVIGVMAMTVGTGLLGVLAAADRLPFRFIDGTLSLAAGLSFMIALGAMSVWRARSNRRAFALSSVATGLALAVARPVGIIAAGITGSFALLFVAYAALAIALPRRLPPPRATIPSPHLAARLIVQSLPLFMTSILWAVYMTANRWIVSFFAPPLELGRFAFGANVLALVVGMVAAISQFYYPAVAIRVAAGPRGSVSRLLLRDLALLAGAGLAIGAGGILVGPTLIELLYRNFMGAEAPMRILLAALPSLLVCSWLVPLGLATATRPWLESAVTLPVALLTLGVSTAIGDRIGGIDGSAWGSCIAAGVLLALLLGAFGRNGLMAWRHILPLFALTALATAALAVLAASPIMLHLLTQNG